MAQALAQQAPPRTSTAHLTAGAGSKRALLEAARRPSVRRESLPESSNGSATSGTSAGSRSATPGRDRHAFYGAAPGTGILSSFVRRDSDEDSPAKGSHAAGAGVAGAGAAASPGRTPAAVLLPGALPPVR